MKDEFNATKRAEQGTGASRRLRRAGRVPGILYGGGEAAQPIAIDHNELFHKLKHEAFHSSILTMILDGTKQQVLLRDVQMHAYKALVEHIDFQRVDVSQKIYVKVPLHFINAEIAPGVKLQGGIASHTVERTGGGMSACRPARVHRSRPEGSGCGRLGPRTGPCFA